MSDLFGNIPVEEKNITASDDSENRIDFGSVIGQSRVKAILTRIIENNRLANSFLFFGPEGCGKIATAIEFAKAINCLADAKKPCQNCSACRQIGSLTHPDFKFVFSGPKNLAEKDIIEHVQKISKNPYLSAAYLSNSEILIDQIRELKKLASFKRYNAKTKVFIISEAEKMRMEAANSLLKLLEEPPESLTLILTTSRLDQVLPTISSRCQMIKFSPLSRDEIKEKCLELGIGEQQSSVISRLSIGNFRKAMDLTRINFQQLRDEAGQLLLAAKQTDIIKKFQLIGELTRGKNRGEIKELFLSAISLLRDVQILSAQTGSLNDLLFNADQPKKLDQLLNIFNSSNISTALDKTEYYIELVDRNIYINLIFINYLNDLSELLQSAA